MRQTPHSRVCVFLGLATVLLAGSAFALAAPGGSHRFEVYAGSDSYRFSPTLPGKFGSQRLFALLGHPDAANRKDLGPMVWRLELRGPNGADRVIRVAGGKTWPDERGTASVELSWDGRTSTGELAPAGRYSFTVSARMVPMRALQGRRLESYDDALRIAGAEEAVPTTDEVVVDYSMTVADSSKMLAGRALVACDPHQNTPIEPGFAYNFYYGGMHSHSRYSDGGHPVSSCASAIGTGTFGPAEVYTYARYTGGVDYWGLADHNHHFDDAVTASAPPLSEAKVLARYQDGLAAAAAATVDDEFIAVYGQEYGVSAGGHYVVLETPGLLGWEYCTTCTGPTPECTPGTNCYFDYYVPKSNYLALYAQSVAHPSPVGPLGSFAHPYTNEFGDFTFNADADAATQGLAVRSGLGDLTGVDNEECLDSNAATSSKFSIWMIALDRGFHVAPTGESDAHCNNYGVAVPTRTVYLLPNGSSPVLTKTALLSAHKNRHFFATEDPNAQIVFATADSSHVMGDIFETTTSVSLRVRVDDPQGESTTLIELFRGQVGGGPPATAYQSVSNQPTFAFTDTASSGTYYYLVRATQQDGHEIFTAPMWVTFGAIPPCTTPPVMSGIPTAADVSNCADSGVGVAWTDITDWQDAGSTGSRAIEVLRSTDGTTWTSCGFDTDQLSPFTDTGGANGTAYRYRVKATNRCGASAQIDTAATATDVVNGPLFAGAASVADPDACALTGLRVTWAAPSSWNDGCTASCNRSFVVYRDATPVSGTLTEGATSFDDTLAPAGAHTYRVEATNHVACANDGGVTRAGTEATNDGTAPLITVGPAAAPAVTSAVITWTTNEPSNSQVEYGLDASYGSPASSPTLVTAHSVTISPLSANTPYHFRVGSTDACGNGPTWSFDATFATQPTPTGLDISGFTVQDVGASLAFTFPAGTVLLPGDYVVIGRTLAQAAFETQWGVTLGANVHYFSGVSQVVNGFPQINSTNRTYQLRNASAVVTDGPTPASLITFLMTNQRTSPAADAGLAGSWVASDRANATPGTGVTGASTGELVITEFSDSKPSPATFDSEFIELYYDATAALPTLTVTRDGSGAGTVLSEPEGIDCGATCQASFALSTLVDLTASPDVGSSFTGWGGDCSGTGTCQVTMDAARAVTATFTVDSYLLTVTTVGSGSVTSAPAGIDCGAVCSTTFTYGTPVDLTATPGSGWTFLEWSGACSGTDPVCHVAMTAVRSATAAFRLPLVPSGLLLDPAGLGSGNQNFVLEPGETVTVAPAWRNNGVSPSAPTGVASAFTGPAGGTYTLVDGTADYGAIATGSDGDCLTGGNCYELAASFSTARPATHWDTTVTETLSTGESKTWTLHVGASFTDVAISTTPGSFYHLIETLLHSGTTAGCDATAYCPTSKVTRAQMGMFVARAMNDGNDAAVPVTGTITGRGDYSCVTGGQSQFGDVLPEAQYCRHVHYMAAHEVTLGCSGGVNYCPTSQVTRGAMAMFVARAMLDGDGNVPTAYSDPVTLRSYDCAVGASLHFDDVLTTDLYCRHAHYLWARGVIDGCSGTSYCPGGLVRRDQMAKFLVNSFGFTLYGP